jgi:hypothetical protein
MARAVAVNGATVAATPGLVRTGVDRPLTEYFPFPFTAVVPEEEEEDDDDDDDDVDEEEEEAL